MVTWLSVSLFKPFRALRYDPERAGSLDRLVAPPYDVVTPELRPELLAESPYNAVRLVRPDAPEEAARELASWQSEGVLVREEEPAVWVLEETFVGPDGVERTRRGLAARIRLEPYATGYVLPHERTFPAPKEARLRLLRATRTKLSPILLLHDGRNRPIVPARPPDLEAVFGGARSRLWRVDDQGPLDARRRAHCDRRRPPPIRDRAPLPRGGWHRGDAPTSWRSWSARDDPGLVSSRPIAWSAVRFPS